jgi:guanylate kinase
VILVIDVQGAAQVRRRYRDAVSVFLRTSSLEILEQRLRGRATDSPESIARRLAAARQELTRADEYDYQVINDDLDAAVVALRAIIARQFRGGP